MRHIHSLIHGEGELSPQQHFPGEEETQNLTSVPLPAEGTLVLVGKDCMLLSPWLLYSVGRVLLLAKKEKKNRKPLFFCRKAPQTSSPLTPQCQCEQCKAQGWAQSLWQREGVSARLSAPRGDLAQDRTSPPGPALTECKEMQLPAPSTSSRGAACLLHGSGSPAHHSVFICCCRVPIITLDTSHCRQCWLQSLPQGQHSAIAA